MKTDLLRNGYLEYLIDKTIEKFYKTRPRAEKVTHSRTGYSRKIRKIGHQYHLKIVLSPNKALPSKLTKKKLKTALLVWKLVGPNQGARN